IGFANWLILAGLAVLLFRVPLKGSAVALALRAVCYVAAAAGLGLVVVAVARRPCSAAVATLVFAKMRMLPFAVLFLHVSTLEGAARIMGQLWPANYFMQMSVGAFSKGLNFWMLAPNIVLILAFVPVFVGLAALLLKKQEA